MMCVTFANAATVMAQEPIGEVPGAGSSHASLVRRDRQRIADTIKVVAADSMDDLIRNLTIESNYLTAGYLSPRANDQMDFSYVLSNRRTLKLVGILAEMPREEARAKCQTLFDQVCKDEYQATLERIVKSYEDSSAPKNTQSMSGNRLALGTILFALAHFADPPQVIEDLQRMDRIENEQFNRMKLHAELYPEVFAETMRLYSRLDNACRVSLIAYSVGHAAHANREHQAEVTRLLGKTSRIIVPLTTWDANETYFEARPLFPPAPGEPPKVLEQVPAYRWGADMLFNYKAQEEILRRLIEICTHHAA
jgi:hypothetical protein